MIIEELIAKLGFELTGEDALKKFKDGLKGAVSAAGNASASMAKRVAKLSAGMASGYLLMAGTVKALGSTMFSLAKQAAGPLDKMIKFSDRIGENFEKVQLWSEVAAQSGASFDEFSNDLEGLASRLGQAARGTGLAAKALKDFGISVKNSSGEIKKPTELLEELMKKFSKLSNAQQLDLAKKLGLSKGTITMLQQGAEEFNKTAKAIQDAGLIFTEQDARNAVAFNDAYAMFGKTLTALKATIGVSLLPALTKLMNDVQQWFNANRAWIKEDMLAATQSALVLFVSLAAALRRITTAAIDLSGYLAGIIKDLTGANFDTTQWWLLAGAIGAVIFWLAPVPATIVAAIAALDDLLAWYQGDKSVMKDFWEYLKGPDLEQALSSQQEAMRNTVRGWFTGIDLYEIGVTIGKTLINGIINAAKGIGNVIKDAIIGAPAHASDPTQWGKKNRGVAPRAHTTAKQGRLPSIKSGGASFDEKFGGGGQAAAGMDQLRSMLDNMNSNLARMAAEPAVNATITDARQDNRQFPFSAPISIGPLTINEAQAPGAVAGKVGAAVQGAVSSQASRIEQEPAQ